MPCNRLDGNSMRFCDFLWLRQKRSWIESLIMHRFYFRVQGRAWNHIVIIIFDAQVERLVVMEQSWGHSVVLFDPKKKKKRIGDTLCYKLRPKFTEWHVIFKIRQSIGTFLPERCPGDLSQTSRPHTYPPPRNRNTHIVYILPVTPRRMHGCFSGKILTERTPARRRGLKTKNKKNWIDMSMVMGGRQMARPTNVTI